LALKVLDKKLDLADRIQMGISHVLRLVLVVAVVESVLTSNWAAMYASLLTLVLSFAPVFLAGRYKVKLPVDFELAIVVFIYGAIFLGGVEGYYVKFWWWDLLLHAGSGFALGFIGFLILYLLHAQGKFRASPFLIAVFAWSFALALGAAWEIFEYAADHIFGTRMQRSGLPDTMADLIVDCIGALFAAGVGYMYMKYRVWDPFDRAIRRFLQNNPRIKRRVEAADNGIETTL
jgi:hypothetical protein